MKGLILCFNLLCFVGYGQIKKLPLTPENLSLSDQSIAFHLTKGKLNPEVIWNNYHSENHIPDTALCDLSSIKIKYSVVYPITLDTIKGEPFVFSGDSRYSGKVIYLPYKKFQQGMNFLITITHVVSHKQMIITVKIDSLDSESPNDRLFCFNYVPFRNGNFCFTGKDIEHWDVQTATINPRNVWVPCWVSEMYDCKYCGVYTGQADKVKENDISLIIVKLFLLKDSAYSYEIGGAFSWCTSRTFTSSGKWFEKDGWLYFKPEQEQTFVMQYPVMSDKQSKEETDKLFRYMNEGFSQALKLTNEKENKIYFRISWDCFKGIWPNNAIQIVK